MCFLWMGPWWGVVSFSLGWPEFPRGVVTCSCRGESRQICFGTEEPTILDYRKSMAMEPINNSYVIEESKRKLQNCQGKESNLHNLVRLPANRAFSKPEFFTRCKTKFFQLRCSYGWAECGSTAFLIEESWDVTNVSFPADRNSVMAKNHALNLDILLAKKLRCTIHIA